MKTNIKHFQHDVDAPNSPKFKMLRSKYGWAGDGRFWALNCMIGNAENCTLDLNKEYVEASIAVDLNLTLEELREFLNFLSEKCKLIIMENGLIQTERTQEVLNFCNKERDRQSNLYKLSTCRKSNSTSRK